MSESTIYNKIITFQAVSMYNWSFLHISNQKMFKIFHWFWWKKFHKYFTAVYIYTAHDPYSITLIFFSFVILSWSYCSLIDMHNNTWTTDFLTYTVDTIMYRWCEQFVKWIWSFLCLYSEFLHCQKPTVYTKTGKVFLIQGWYLTWSSQILCFCRWRHDHWLHNPSTCIKKMEVDLIDK